MREILSRIREACRERGLDPPARATVYRLLDSLPGPSYRVGDLPAPVREALYNLVPDSVVPGRQVAFYCVNYGRLAAVCFAAGLPWLAIRQALRMRGHRRRSRGLLEAVARVRGI